MELIKCIDRCQWDAFVDASPQGSIFSRTAFLEALGAKYELWWVVESAGVQLGALLFIDGNDDGRPAPFSFALYHGVLFARHLSTVPPHRAVRRRLELIDFLLHRLEERYGRISFCLHPTFSDARAFTWFHHHVPERGHFRVDLQYTGWISLQGFSDFESYLRTIRKVRRYEYDKALKEGLTVEESDDVGSLLKLYRQTFARQGMCIDPVIEEHARAVATTAIAEGFGELLIARSRDRQMTSAALFLFDQRCGYYLIGANDPEYRSTGSGTLVVLDGIRRCQSRGLTCIDVCGINSPNRGDFKTSFNAVPTPYMVTTWERPLN